MTNLTRHITLVRTLAYSVYHPFCTHSVSVQTAPRQDEEQNQVILQLWWQESSASTLKEDENVWSISMTETWCRMLKKTRVMGRTSYPYQSCHLCEIWNFPSACRGWNTKYRRQPPPAKFVTHLCYGNTDVRDVTYVYFLVFDGLTFYRQVGSTQGLGSGLGLRPPCDMFGIFIDKGNILPWSHFLCAMNSIGMRRLNNSWHGFDFQSCQLRVLLTELFRFLNLSRRNVFFPNFPHRSSWRKSDDMFLEKSVVNIGFELLPDLA